LPIAFIIPLGFALAATGVALRALVRPSAPVSDRAPPSKPDPNPTAAELVNAVDRLDAALARIEAELQRLDRGDAVADRLAAIAAKLDQMASLWLPRTRQPQDDLEALLAEIADLGGLVADVKDS
jgi:hypothetical protein